MDKTKHRQFIPAEVRHRSEELLARMTLEEKIGQMVQYDFFCYNINVSTDADAGRQGQYDEMIRKGLIGSVFNIRGAEEANRLQKIAVEESRLGIPLLVGRDVIHGYKTVFPIPLAQASSWNPELIEEAYAISAREAATEGIQWIFAPMLDVTRDPRWGRIAEGPGEDTYLGEAIARAMVKGLQRNDWKDEAHVMSCPKHYAAYGATEAGRDYNTVDMSERTLREVFLPAFKAAVEEGALTVMSSFNELNGIPACANKFLLNRVLREEWGFEGFVVSDYNAVYELLNHGLAADQADACEKSIKAGLDMDMHSGIYAQYLSRFVQDGKVDEGMIDTAVVRILNIKFLLGLFEHPYVTGEKARNVLLAPEHVKTARELARESMVLLKNRDTLLPLDKSIKSLAVIGPLADNRENPLGCWAFDGNPDTVVTVLEGIRSKVGAGTDVYHAKGCDFTGLDTEGFAEAVAIAEKADAVILVVGESADLSGEGHSRTSLALPGVQEELVKAVHAAGKPVIVVLMNGRPLTISWLHEHVPAILEAWHPGIESGNAIADVLFGDYNPGGKLTASFPRNVGQIPVYYNRKNTGRPPNGPFTSDYLDSSVEPLYPFGYGLSYTRFAYENLQLSAQSIKPDGNMEVSIEVKNIGDREGSEIVQLYLQDVAASVTRPVKQLKGFEKVRLQSGESRRISFTLTPEHLAFHNEDMVFAVEPGTFKVWVGPDSTSGVEGSFTVEG